MAELELRDHRGDTVYVDEHFDSDGDLEIGGYYFKRSEVARLRDHLTVVLADGPKPVDVAQAAREVAEQCAGTAPVFAAVFRNFAEKLEGGSK